jgi:hypothetical protein
MDSDVLYFFEDELEKLASDPRRKRHQYYMRNKNRIQSQQRMYRKKNAHKIKRRQKIYRRQVGAGMRRQRKRISTGSSYTYGGYR